MYVFFILLLRREKKGVGLYDENTANVILRRSYEV